LDAKKEIGMNGYLLAPFEQEDDITQAIKLLEGASLLVLIKKLVSNPAVVGQGGP
jgi:hypothetical protein